MGISWFQIMIILVIVILIFGTKKLRSLGSDLGGGLREFKKAVKDEEKNSKIEDNKGGNVYENENDEPTVKKDKDRS